MRLLLPLLLVPSFSALRVAHTAAGAARDAADDAVQTLQQALDSYSDGNYDDSMGLEEAVQHVVHRGVPPALADALIAANMTHLSPALLERTVADADISLTSDQDADASAAPKVNAVVARIFKVINGMIIADQNKLVLKVFECNKQKSAFKSGYRTNRLNFHSESYKLEEALSSEKFGQLEQFEAEVRLRKLVPARDALHKQCVLSIDQLQATYKRMKYDYTLAGSIISQTSCAKQKMPSFLQSCMRVMEDGRKEAMVQFAPGTSGRQMMDLMQTSEAKAAVARGLIEAVGPENLEGTPLPELYEVRSRVQRGEGDGEEQAAFDDEEDELTHREVDFSDYFFQDSDADQQSGLVDTPFHPTAKDLEDDRDIDAAVAGIQTETEDGDKDISDADAPPGGWISEKALAEAAKELVGAQDSKVSLLKQRASMNRTANANFLCTAAATMNCPRFRDRLEMMLAELLGELQHTEFLLSTTRSECTKQISDLDTQIESMDAKKADGARIEALATAQKSDSQRSIMVIEREGRMMLKNFAKQSKECASTLKNLQSAVCGSKKLKQEVITIEAKQRTGARLEVNDCSVGTWRQMECMNTKISMQLAKQNIFNPQQAVTAKRSLKSLLHNCGAGGGVQWYLRDIQSPPKTPQYGADCPPLRLKTVCNDFECPINCKLGDWEGWSACSKTCDGGLMRRVRTVKVYPQWGGSECDSTKDEETCNALACDRQCVLHDWSPWRQCTRACDTGTKWRSRAIKSSATGSGSCPVTFSKARYEKEACNTAVCPLDVMCVAKMDLVIGIDASGSLTEDGWKSQRTALLGLVKRMVLSKTTGVQLGLLKFSYKVKVMQHFTDDKKLLTKAVTNVKFDRWTTNVGGAFRTMQSMLKFGRRDAPSVCVMWTDGRASRPSSRYDAKLAADALKQTCRVMVVTMVAGAASFSQPWVSHPVEHNAMTVTDALLMKDKVTEINTFICARVQPYLEWTKANPVPTTTTSATTTDAFR
jgi:hypothetical protein